MTLMRPTLEANVDSSGKIGLSANIGPSANVGPSGHIGLSGNAATDKSEAWFARARQALAGGISSSARSTTTGARPYPLYMARGRGGRIWDVDGNEFIDLLLSYGSLPLGHADADVVAAVQSQLQLGTMFGTCNTPEVELAEQICRMVPGADLVRYANSGSEAIAGAVRAARGFTGKHKLLKFEGHYHGWMDVLAISNRPTAAQAGPPDAPVSVPHSLGIPPALVGDVVIAPWNDAAALKAILDAHDGEFAAAIAEPVVANNACTMPADGYLQTLRDECTKRKIVLIFDEIVTGFRLAPGGAQQAFGIPADLCVFSKAIGGGFPLSAFTGSREIMAAIAANTVKHGGTYNGNPISAAAAGATLAKLAKPATLVRMHEVGRSFMQAIERGARDNGVECVVQGAGAMFQVVFGRSQPTRCYRDFEHADMRRYAAFRDRLLEHGVHANASGLACFFVCSAHTEEEERLACKAIEIAMKSLVTSD